MTLPRIKTPKSTYIHDYPQAIIFSETQAKVFWLDKEIKVEKDIQDIRVNMTEAERHGVITTLKLFTLYELLAGNEYWGTRVMKMFPRPDIQRMANIFSFFELNVHAPFYARLNESLSLNTEEFYTDYVNDETLSGRMSFLNDIIDSEDDLLSLGVFSMVEGAILYSSFAFLKHFQARGKNKLKNVVSGINFSVRDENIHSMGGAWLFRTLLQEEMELGLRTPEQVEQLKERIREAGRVLFDHESRIIDMIFEKGEIKGITPVQMKHFVESRVNLCLSELKIPTLFEVSYNPIAEWFYKNINSVQLHDFFAGVGNSYKRDWDESSFQWIPKSKREEVGGEVSE